MKVGNTFVFCSVCHQPKNDLGFDYTFDEQGKYICWSCLAIREANDSVNKLKEQSDDV